MKRGERVSRDVLNYTCTPGLRRKLSPKDGSHPEEVWKSHGEPSLNGGEVAVETNA